jgi:hypothetical protein
MVRKVFLTTALSLFLMDNILIYAQSIVITLSIEKERYLLAEPIFIGIQAVNNSQDSIVIDKIDLLQSFVLTSDNYRDFFHYIEYSRAKPLKSNFGPGDTLNYFFDVSSLIGVRDISIETLYYLPVGTYTGAIKNYTAKKGLIEKVPNRPPFGIIYNSNQIHFTVVEPEGEEHDAFEILYKAKHFRWIEKNRDDAFKEYIKLADNYPQSVYAVKALISAGYIYIHNNNRLLREKSHNILVRSLLEYPDSRYIMEAVDILVMSHQNINDRGGLINILEEVANANPGTKAAIIASKKLAWARTVPDDLFDPKKVSEKTRRKMEEFMRRNNE